MEYLLRVFQNVHPKEFQKNLQELMKSWEEFLEKFRKKLNDSSFEGVHGGIMERVQSEIPESAL